VGVGVGVGSGATGVPAGTTVTSDVAAGSLPVPPQAPSSKAVDTIAVTVIGRRQEQALDRIDIVVSCRDNVRTPKDLSAREIRKNGYNPINWRFMFRKERLPIHGLNW